MKAFFSPASTTLRRRLFFLFGSRLRVARLRTTRQSGVALVLVLSFLALTLALVVAFFLTATTEMSSAKSYAQGATAKQLSESAVQIAMASIRTATATGANIAWASQPGMIRTYDSAGKPVKVFKLYSSNEMVQTIDRATDFVPGNDLRLTPTDGPTAWLKEPAFFTDLNSPVIASGSANFPIIDGNGISISGTKLKYTGSNVPEGFSVDPDQVSFDGSKPVSTKNNPVPVPAKWLYVLENGAIVAPTLATSGTGAVATVAGADASPIVGRIAFWTDDETAKVNINTAGEGTFWDMPRAEGGTERSFGSHQPATREFQRYPGHPATTSLSAVFPRLLPFPTPAPPAVADKSAFYAITPRVSATGANPNGTPNPGGVTLDHDRLYTSIDELVFDPTSSAANPPVRNPNPNPASTPAPVSSPLLQGDIQQAKFFITAYNRAPEVNLFNKPRITIWPIDKSYTTNLSNSKGSNPRVTPTDQLIAFCSTMRNDLGVDRYPYYFQRQSTPDVATGLTGPDSAVADINIRRNREIYTYLQGLTSANVPGFSNQSLSSNFISKYGDDRDQILTEIFDYIRTVNLTDAVLGGGMPGSGGPPNGSATAAATYAYAPARTVQVTNNLGFSTPQFSAVYPWAHGLVAPTEYTATAGNPTRGFGRFDTISGAFLWFAGVAQTTASTATPPNVVTHNQDGSDSPAPANPSPPVGNTRVQAIFALDFFNPGYNWPYPMCGFEYSISGLENFKWRPQGAPSYNSMLFPAGGQISSYWKGNQLPGGRQGFALALSQKSAPSTLSATPANNVSKSRSYYPFVSGATVVGTMNTADFPTAGSYIDFKGGEVTISLLFNQVEIQSIKMKVPDGTFPIPGLANANFTGTTPNRNFRYFFFSPSGPVTVPPTLGGRFYTDNSAIYVDPSDTIEEIIATSGDYRTIAGRRTIVPLDNLFQTHPDYGKLDVHFAHNLWGEGRYPILGATYGSLANGVQYGNDDPRVDGPNWMSGHARRTDGSLAMAQSWWSNIPSRTGVVVGSAAAFAPGSIPGDWDNGMADEQDGSYINKVDEGNLWGLDPNGTAPPGTVPYFTSNYRFLTDPTAGKSYFSPNRQIPSAGMFGSLPTGVNRHLPWQTLLFRPDPVGHPGQSEPPTGGPPYSVLPDYLLMDLFTMPVAEPYAISEPFSTAGRVNMNYQIVPFTYITRETAVRAALKAEQVMAIPTEQGSNYKANANNASYRFNLNMDETLTGFKDRFATGDIFRSAAEICSIHLVPQMTGVSYSTMQSGFWDKYRLTGDNTRERPYANIYPRLTTKSNTYTVHYRAQALKKAIGQGVATQWNESRDAVVGEFRGSSLVERYIDPNDSGDPNDSRNPGLPDFVTKASETLDKYYRLRVISTKQFDR